MENQNQKTDEPKIVCKYKNANAYVMACEKEVDASTDDVVEVTENVETQTAEPAAEPVVEVTETVEVPIVGDTTETDASYAEPLGESTSWYPEAQSYDSLMNYEYGTSTTYIASLTNPEVGVNMDDILLIVLIALGCLAVLGSTVILAGRALNNRATHKDFLKK